MDIPVELRRKMIIALIEALKESSSFGNIQISQLKEAVLSSENKTYMQAKSREEYLYFINEKLKKIMNASAQRFEFRSGNSVKGNYPDEPLDRGYSGPSAPEQGGGRGFGKVPDSPFSMINIPSPYANGASPFNGPRGYQGNKGQFTPTNSPQYANGYIQGHPRGTPQMNAYPTFQGGSPMVPRAGGISDPCSESNSPVSYGGMNSPANASGKRNDMPAPHQAPMVSGIQGQPRADFGQGGSPYARPNPMPSNPMSSNPMATNPMSSNPMAANPMSSNPMSSNPMSSNPMANSYNANHGFRNDLHFANKMKGSADPRRGDFSTTNRSYIGNVGNRLYSESGVDGRKMFQNGYPDARANEKRSPSNSQQKPTGGLFYGYNADRGSRRQSPPVVFQNGAAHGNEHAHDAANSKAFPRDANRQEASQPYMNNAKYARTNDSSPTSVSEAKVNTDEDAFNALSQDFFTPEALFRNRKEDNNADQPGASAALGRCGGDRVTKLDKSDGTQHSDKDAMNEYIHSRDAFNNDSKHKSTAIGAGQDQAQSFGDNCAPVHHVSTKHDGEFNHSALRSQPYFDALKSVDSPSSHESADTKLDYHKLPQELESYLTAHSLKPIHISGIDDWKKKLRTVSANLSPGDNSEHKRMIAMQCKYMDHPFIETSFLSSLLERSVREPVDGFDYSEYFERSVNAFEAVRAINKDSVFQLSSDDSE